MYDGFVRATSRRCSGPTTAWSSSRTHCRRVARVVMTTCPFTRSSSTRRPTRPRSADFCDHCVEMDLAPSVSSCAPPRRSRSSISMTHTIRSASSSAARTSAVRAPERNTRAEGVLPRRRPGVARSDPDEDQRRRDVGPTRRPTIGSAGARRHRPRRPGCPSLALLTPPHTRPPRTAWCRLPRPPGDRRRSHVDGGADDLLGHADEQAAVGVVPPADRGRRVSWRSPGRC